MRDEKPLVSIMIPNYNHSQYLDRCVKSAIDQTYKNLDIIILDNASEDNSVKVAEKYVGKSVRVCRNPRNIFNSTYKVLDTLAIGKYRMLLCADDFIAPTFVEKAVAIMENYPNVGYVHGERDFINESGEVIVLDPFYNCSFVAPGENVMPIYMVTTVAHPSQGIFREDVFHKMGGYDMEIDHMNADKMLWFYLSYVSDYAYIREKMSYIQIGNQTETFITQSNFQHPILCHLTIKEMVKFSKEKGLEAVYDREKEALDRLAGDFINYAIGMIIAGNKVCARRYMDYVKVLSENVPKTKEYIKIDRVLQGSDSIDLEYLKQITESSLQKTRNYQPPLNYNKINLEDLG